MARSAGGGMLPSSLPYPELRVTCLLDLIQPDGAELATGYAMTNGTFYNDYLVSGKSQHPPEPPPSTVLTDDLLP